MTTDSLAKACAACIHERFQDYQTRFRQITLQAPDRFRHRQWAHRQVDSTERLNLYGRVVDQSETAVRDLLQGRVAEGGLWTDAKTDFSVRIEGRADRDLAETFFNSVTRRIFATVGVNRRIEFVYDTAPPPPPTPDHTLISVYPLSGRMEAVVERILGDQDGFRFDRAVLAKTLPAMAARLADRIDHHPRDDFMRIEMLRCAFYRGQGAYLIGRIVASDRTIPLVMALLHPPDGVVVDAMVLDSDGVSIVFSFTRSAFHVPVNHPGELVGFLKSIMPSKPEAEIYSSIGYFKHSKTVLYRELCRHTAECVDQQFNISSGKRGMVMIVFDLPGYDTVVKVIRDRFDNPKKTSRQKVMTQYDFVFNHYRVGRLIEANTFEHLSFNRCWFADALLAQLLDEAAQTIHLEGDRVIIDHAYLERRVTPLDIYLQTESGQQAAPVVVDFGNAIKDLAFANIFPGDMLLKNFGVTRHGRVVFYDYDEIVPLTECRFRKIPPARSHMEEMADEPWYTVAENDVFPEEFAHFLGLSAAHRDLFLSRHADLLSTGFWVAAQQEIRSGHIRHIRPYRARYRLQPDI